jgi:hypothetical protein
VIDALKARHAQQRLQPRKLAYDPKLSAAAKRIFGSVRAAKEAAGVPYRPRNKTRELWTEVKVIEAIVSLSERGELRSSSYKENPTLYSSAKRMFGSWNEAKKAAGVLITKPQSLRANDVIHLVKERSHQNLPMTHLWQTESRLYSAIKRHFGNLPNALEVAGIPMRRREVWTKARIIGLIRHRQEHGPPLAHVWRDDKRLFSAATKHFGNWRNALKAALVPIRKRERWSKSKIIEGLKATYRGQPRFREQYPDLAGAAYRFFGGFFQALEAAGLEPPVGRWTKARIIESIQELYMKKLPLEISGCGDKRLAYAAKRHFGNWREAVKAAGLESRLPPVATTKVWTRAMVIKAIQVVAASESGLSRAWCEHSQLYEVAFRLFGTWNDAVLSAGFKPSRRRWTSNAVLDEIRARQSAGLPLSSSIFKEDPPLAGAATRLFGSWSLALDAAGIPMADRIIPHRTPFSRRKSTNVA